MDKNLFAGVDPGQTGGIGVVDFQGNFVAAHRWTKKNPRDIYSILYNIRERVIIAYIEDVRVFPRESKGFITSNQGLLINSGVWQGFMIALRISYQLIPMATWQSASGLHHWQAKLRANPAQDSPLTLARRLWPGAPLSAQVDDGPAVGCLLADLARRDHRAGIDRAVMQQKAKIKAKAKRARIRQNAKLPLTKDIPW